MVNLTDQFLQCRHYRHTWIWCLYTSYRHYRHTWIWCLYTPYRYYRHTWIWCLYTPYRHYRHTWIWCLYTPYRHYRHYRHQQITLSNAGWIFLFQISLYSAWCILPYSLNIISLNVSVPEKSLMDQTAESFSVLYNQCVIWTGQEWIY